MKKFILLLVVLIFIVFNPFRKSVLKKGIEIIEAKKEVPVLLAHQKVIETKTKGLDIFLNDIAFRESSNNYSAVNSLGYLGKYQFGMSTLKTLKINTTKKEFLKNKKLQEIAMKKNLRRNKRLLNKIIKENENSVVDNVKITESGILAAAHLAGPNGIKKYFKKGIDKNDSYGTKTSDYLKMFSGYEIEL